MENQTLNVPVAGPQQAKHMGIAPGRERFAFLYAVIAAAAIASAMIYSGIAGLAWWQSVFLVIGTVIVGWAILFSILEVRRLAQSPEERAAEALEEGPNAYPARTLTVDKPTGEPYPHHEDHTESPGFDQGQLTSRIPETTPFIDKLVGPERR